MSKITDVTTNNFTRETLEEIRSAIRGAHFVAVDTEFSGLRADAAACYTAFDTPKERYENHLRKTASQFLLLQFGLSTFTPVEGGKYENKTFNFYLWPRPFHASLAPDPRFLCQTSCIDFLVSHDFDFNKLFKEGVSYIRLSDEPAIRKTLEARQAAFNNVSAVPVPRDQEEFIRDVHRRIREYATGDDGEPLEIGNCNGFQRKLIFQTVKDKFKESVYLETVKKSDKERVISVTKTTSNDFNEKREAKSRKALEELDDAMGFTKVIIELMEAKKPIVGHNMLLDVCYVLNAFVSPLPESYEDFKERSLGAFPVMFDTKVIASTHPFKDHFLGMTTLEELKARFTAEPFEVPEIDPPFESENRYHEAGYDAFVTGLAFLTMYGYLNKLGKRKKTEAPSESDLLRPFRNKFYAHGISDVPYFNIGGNDIEPSRLGVFHLRFPSVWKASDINSLFSPVGQVQISWIDSTSAYVSVLNDESSPEKVMRTLGDSASGVYAIRPFKSEPTTIAPIDYPLKSKRSAPSETIALLKRAKNRPDCVAFKESSDWN